jgi:hypothetical protein
MSEFTEKWTRKTFTNQDSDVLHVYLDFDTEDRVVLSVNNEEFWFPIDKTNNIADAIRSIGEI